MAFFFPLFSGACRRIGELHTYPGKYLVTQVCLEKRGLTAVHAQLLENGSTLGKRSFWLRAARQQR